MDRGWVEWNDLTNDKEKRRYCNELEEVIKDLEDELDSKNKEVEKLFNTRKQLGICLAVFIIFLFKYLFYFFYKIFITILHIFTIFIHKGD